MSTDRQRQDYPDNAVSSRELRAVVERYEDAPDQCTIFPTGLDDHERMATWVSAREPSFVELEAVR
jgi:hypothetical protein